jgi:hypothetical protein
MAVDSKKFQAFGALGTFNLGYLNFFIQNKVKESQAYY